MSNNKRAVLTPFEPQIIGNEKVEKRHLKTVRIRLPLAESTEDKCPIFNYKDELAAAKKKLKQDVKDSSAASAPNGFDVFGDENDYDVQKIALEMEAKYGTGMSSGMPKKKRKGRKDDYADIGAGYDENDSFIDNTDGYDEVIPHNVTTVRGGFYINSGALEFRVDDDASSGVSSSSSEADSSEDSDQNNEEKLKKDESVKRKRILSSSEEDEGNSTESVVQDTTTLKLNNDDKEKDNKPNISLNQAIKKKMFSSDKIHHQKKPKLIQPSSSSSSSVNNKEIVNNKEKKSDSTNNGTDILHKENKKPMRLSSVVAAIDSVLAGSPKSLNKSDIRPSEEVKSIYNIVERNEIEKKNFLLPKASLLKPKPSSTAESACSDEIVNLPENLPSDILNIIEKVKNVAKDSGKTKIFNDEMNALLINLLRKCKILGKPSRQKVFAHLAPFANCRKENLIKRVKNLLHEDDNRNLCKVVDNLKAQINQLMPSLINSYEKEYQHYQQRILQIKCSSPETANNEELIKNLKHPRRRFPLHEAFKKLIRDIVTHKKHCLIFEGQSRDNLETLLANYLKSDILSLWPDGWMSMTILKKYCTAFAIKTPDSKGTVLNAKHSQPISTLPSSMSSSIAGCSSSNSLTVKSVNLDVTAFKDTKLSPIMKETPSLEPSGNETNSEKSSTTIHKIREPPDLKDNGVIVISSSKMKMEPPSVINNSSHCPIIDLTDTFSLKSVLDDAPKLPPPLKRFKPPIKEMISSTLNPPDLSLSRKSKYSVVSGTANNSQAQEDVLKVMENLKALQKMSLPSSKSDISSNPAVSVIAFSNKNHSSNSNNNSLSGHGSGSNGGTSLTFPENFQKEFVSSLNNLNKSSQSNLPKTGYNRCS